jgi:hypothetical protein
MPPWWNTRYAGKPAGRPDSEGYFPIKLTFDGRKRWLLAHRVVFALVVWALGRLASRVVGLDLAERRDALRGSTLTGAECELQRRSPLHSFRHLQGSPHDLFKIVR